jgi:hypothetical protein
MKTLLDSIRLVQVVYPRAILEWPSKLCSVSGHPGGPEISRQCLCAKSAWFDAARKLSVRDKTKADKA